MPARTLLRHQDSIVTWGVLLSSLISPDLYKLWRERAAWCTWLHRPPTVTDIARVLEQTTSWRSYFCSLATHVWERAFIIWIEDHDEPSPALPDAPSTWFGSRSRRTVAVFPPVRYKLGRVPFQPPPPPPPQIVTRPFALPKYYQRTSTRALSAHASGGSSSPMRSSTLNFLDRQIYGLRAVPFVAHVIQR